LNILPQN